jgi:hypothetical protein
MVHLEYRLIAMKGGSIGSLVYMLLACSSFVYLNSTVSSVYSSIVAVTFVVVDLEKKKVESGG